MKPYLSIIIGLLLCGTIHAASTDATLARAWQEYSFQAWGQAETFFKEVIEKHGAESAEGRDARSGLAMIKQFNTQKRNLAAARDAYAQILKDITDGPRYVLLTSLYAECAWHTGQKKEADIAWQSLLNDHPHSLLTQDALLQRTLLHMEGITNKETAEAIAYLQKNLKRLPAAKSSSPGLRPVFMGLIGDYHLQTNKPKDARDAYMQALDLSTPQSMSYSIFAGRLFQVARISEEDLDDTKTAGKYYRRLVDETPNDSRFFFSLEKAAAYKTITPDEVRALNRQGLSDNVISELFKEDLAP